MLGFFKREMLPAPIMLRTGVNVDAVYDFLEGTLDDKSIDAFLREHANRQYQAVKVEPKPMRDGVFSAVWERVKPKNVEAGLRAWRDCCAAICFRNEKTNQLVIMADEENCLVILNRADKAKGHGAAALLLTGMPADPYRIYGDARVFAKPTLWPVAQAVQILPAAKQGQFPAPPI